MNRRLLAACVLVFACLAALAACKSTRESGEGGFGIEEVALDVETDGRAFVPTLGGPLRVMSATPYGPTQTMAPDQPVAVTFSRPMVPLGDAPRVDPNTLTLDPAVAGTLAWDGTQTLVFTPSAPLPPATPFRMRLAALPSVDGERSEPFEWRFETPRPQLAESTPARGEPYAEPSAPLRLDFNQPVNAGAATRFVILTRTGNDRVDVQVTADGDSTLVVRPAQALAGGTAYTLRLLPGLPSAVGPLGMADTTTVAFTTYGPLRLVRVDQDRPYYDENPRLDPRRGVRLTFSTPVRFGDLRRAVRLDPVAALPPGIEARDGAVSAEHTLPFELAPETSYTLTVRNLTDAFGQTLAQDQKTFATRAYEPSLSVPGGILVLDAEQSTALPLHVTNVESVRVGVRRLRADQIVPVLRAYDREHWYGDLPEGAAEPEPVAATGTFRPGLARNKPGVVPFPLDSVLTGGTGVVGIHLLGPGRNEERDAEQGHRAMAQVTRLGITAKFSPHQNLFLVTDLATAAPVEGAGVTVRDGTNRVRWQGTTDRTGRVQGPGWAGLGIEKPNPWNEPQQFVFVEKGGDLAFTASMYQDGLEPYRFDVAVDWNPEPRQAAGTVFTDRGLYRAGETAFLKAILRSKTDGDWRAIRDSVRVFVRSPRDETVLDRRVLPSDWGTFDLDWTAPASAAQGVYTVRIAYAADTAAASREPWEQGDLASGTFRVEAFRRAGFDVTARTPAPAYVVGDFFEGTVEGRYLFGSPMGGQPAQVVLSASPTSFTPPGFDAFRFGALDTGYGYDEIARRDTVLDGDGTVALRIPLTGNENGSPRELRWEGTVTDPARQTQSGRTTVPLHPGLFYVGLRPRTTFLDLSERDAMQLDIVTVDPAGRPVGSKGVTVELIRRQWNSVREVGADGRLRWRSETVEEPMGRRMVTTTAGRMARLTMPVTEGGSYLVRASARDVRGNAIRSEAYFYATGSGYVAWERADDDRIDLVPDHTTYAPGETAKVMVQSPYESATALVTVEREGILSSRVVTLEGSAPQIEIPLTENHLPNVFVSVVLLNGRAAPPSATDDAGAPSFKIGYTTLRVDPGVRHLRVEVEPNEEQYRPGDEVTVDLRLTGANGRGVAGEIAFSAADAGVLNLIGYALPDPFETFYGPRPLGVTTSETLSNLVRQRNFGQKEEDVGGGGGGGSDLLRKDFRPLAHWAPAVRTDARGRARVTFRLPESLTTFRLMATALSADHRFGAGQTDVVVTQPLVLQPALPRFARLDDRFEAGVLVTNRTDASGEATVAAEADGLTLRGDAAKRVRLDAGETQEVRFEWTAGQTGEANLRFTAELGRERDAFAVSLPMALPTTKTTTATFAATDGTAQEALSLPPDRVPGLGGLRVTLASTALAGLDGATRYLFQYPYGCLEQTTSRVRPLLVGTTLLDAFDLDALGGDRQQVVEAWLGSLDEYWTGDGFGLWAGDRYTNPYLSAYVVLALAEAKAAGFAIPADLTRDVVAALERSVRNRSAKPEYYDAAVWSDTRALMLYALARHGRVLAPEIDALAQNPAQLSTEGQSLLLRTVVLAGRGPLASHRAPLLDRLRQRVRVESTTAYLDMPEGGAWGWIFASDTRATAYGLAALVEADPSADTRQLGQRMIRYLMQTRDGGHWASTQDNAAVVDAFRAFFEAYDQTAPDFAAEVQVAGRRVLREQFAGRSLNVADATVPLANLPAQAPVTIRKTGPGQAYYALTLDTYSAAPQESRSRGLAVERRLQKLDERGQPVSSSTATSGGTVTLDAGELVQVTLRLTTPTARSYVVLDDALPAGLEALNADFETTADAVREQTGSDDWWGSFNHTEFRDDRVVLFADYLHSGEHTYTYVARATTPGTFVHPPASAEAMYQPETNGRTATGTLVVRPPRTSGTASR